MIVFILMPAREGKEAHRKAVLDALREKYPVHRVIDGNTYLVGCSDTPDKFCKEIGLSPKDEKGRKQKENYPTQGVAYQPGQSQGWMDESYWAFQYGAS